MKLCNVKKTHLDVFSNMSLFSKNSRIDFLLKIVLASLIASIGFITNSQEGVIGSMLISPFGGPIMGLVSAVIVFDVMSSVNSIFYLILGFGIMVIVGMIIGYVNRTKPPTEEMKKRYTKPTKWTLINGVCIGIVFSIVALSSGSAITEGIGAGIAISLLPPVVNCGVTIMNNTIDTQEKYENTKNTLLITGLNIVGIIIASILIFSIHCKNKDLFEWE